MKPISIILLAGLVSCCACSSTAQDYKGYTQEYKTHVSREFTPQKAASGTVLTIYNLNGSVRVEGYAGDKVVFEIDERLTAKTDGVLEQGKKEFKLDFAQGNDTIMAWISAPYDSRPNRNWNRDEDFWGERKRIEYRYYLDFVVKVPYSMNLNVSTVNNGSMTVKDVHGSLRVHNVNGSVTVENAKSGTMDIRTVNGNVTVTHTALPATDAHYHTINGKLEITYPANLSADLQFRSMNGAFYTDFPDVEVLPGKVEKTESRKADGVIYKLSKNHDVRVGAGGKTYSFETLNGNIYIKKQS